MSLKDEMARLSTQAQATLAELGGAAPGKKNSLYNGTPLLAVYGQDRVEMVPQVSGGYKKIVFVTTTVTRAQLGTPPVSGRTWTRTDLSPQQSYTIHAVGNRDAYVYTLTLVKAGA